MACIMAFAGCRETFDNELIVTDKGFEVKADVIWSSDYMAYTLNLLLSEGEEGECTFSYVIDSDHSLRLQSTDGEAVEAEHKMTLSSKTPCCFILPAMVPDAAHSISMEFTKEGVKRSYTVGLPDTSQNAVGIRMDTSAELDFSRVILTNLMGASVTTYNVTFSLDGELLTGIKYMSNTFEGSMDIDFARSESYTFELPYIVAGQHQLTVKIKSTLGSESSSVAFTEPQRRQTSLNLSYNSYTGNLMLESDYNPLETEFDITVSATVNGQITYRHKQFLGVAKERTEYFSEKAESTVTVTPGITAVTVDKGLLKGLMDKVFGNTRVDASNFIGNGNARTLHADITSIDLKFTIHSKGDYAGKTVVTLSPTSGRSFPINYRYQGTTWKHGDGYSATFYPTYSVNGKSPSSIHSL